MRPLTTEEYRLLDSLLPRVGSALSHEGYSAERLSDLVGAIALTGEIGSAPARTAPENDNHAQF
jgi:hypothetical protein